MRTPLLLPLLLCGVALASDPVASPSFGRHYFRSLGCGALGALAGGVVMGVASDQLEGHFIGAGAGVGLGSVVGSAWGASTISPHQESQGSFGLDLLAGIAGGYLLGLAGYGVGMGLEPNDEDVAGGLAAAGTVLGIPLGAVLAQRWVAGEADVALWMPADSRALGLRASWSLR